MADSLSTLRPNAVANAFSWTATGAADVSACTNDNSDSSYATKTTAVVGDFFSVFCGTFTLPTLAQVTRVTPRARGKVTVGNLADWLVRVGIGTAGVGYVDCGFNFASQKLTTTISTNTANTYNLLANGLVLTQADIDAMSLKPIFNPTSSKTINIYELYLDVYYNEVPVVSAITPTGTVSDTATPLIGWTYTDPEGDVQERYQVKIFSAAQYGAGGFDPETSTASSDSGEVFSSDNSHTVDTALANGTTYKAYIKVADANSYGRYSVWTAGSTFTTSLTVPTAPTIVALQDEANARVQLTITGSAFADPQRWIIQRATDDMTWANLDRLYPTDLTYTDVVSPTVAKVVYDYEAPREALLYYRVQAQSTVGINVVSSAWSSTSSTALSNDGRHWLKHLDDPTLNIVITPKGREMPLTSSDRLGVFDVLGRSRPVVFTDVVTGETGSLDLLFLTVADYDAYEVLRRTGTTLLYQNPYGREFYIHISQRTTTDIFSPSKSINRPVSMSFIEVDAP